MKTGYRKIQIKGNGLYRIRKRRNEEKFLEEETREDEGEKGKKVDGQRKRKTEKKHKGDSRYRKSRNGKVKGQKEKRKRDELPEE
jgi:hypothetical protein